MVRILQQSEAQNQPVECSQKAVPVNQGSLSAVLLGKPALGKTQTRHSQDGICRLVPALCRSSNGRFHLWPHNWPPRSSTGISGRTTRNSHTEPVERNTTGKPYTGISACSCTKESLSMLSDAVDWSHVAACVANKTNCICYGHQAQRLNIVPDTCNAAINYGWISSLKL